MNHHVWKFRTFTICLSNSSCKHWVVTCTCWNHLGKMIPISTDNIYMCIHIRTQTGNSIFSLWNMQNPVNTALTTHRIFSKYWDILSTYHTCPTIWNIPFYYLLMCLKYCCMYGKQWHCLPSQTLHSAASDLNLHCLQRHICPIT